MFFASDNAGPAHPSITEAMILRACRELEQAWHYPEPARKAG